MLHTLWSVKGGTGVTVLSTALASVMARRTGRVVLVDLCGDVPAASGLPDPYGPGVRDWLVTPDGSAEALERLLVQVDDTMWLLPRGSAGEWPVGRAADLVTALQALGCAVVVDAGRRAPRRSRGTDGLDPMPDPSRVGEVLAAAGSSWLVIRPCYLALRRARAHADAADGIVLLLEVGRALGRRDIAQTLGIPVVTTVEVDPAVARAVDSGLLLRHTPRALGRALGALT